MTDRDKWLVTLNALMAASHEPEVKQFESDALRALVRHLTIPAGVKIYDDLLKLKGEFE